MEKVLSEQSPTLQIANKIKRTLGTKGRKIQVETNHLPLILDNLEKLRMAVHYDVTIDPDRPKKMLRPAMEIFRKTYFPNRYPSFDGTKNLYAASALPFKNEIEGEVEIEEDESRKKVFKIAIKFANFIDLSVIKTYLTCNDQNVLDSINVQEAIQCIDIVLRTAPASSFISVGRSYFSPPKKMVHLGEGMGLYQGFYLSSILGWKPFLNVDVAHKAFPIGFTFVELVDEFFKTTPDKVDLRKLSPLEKHLKELKVEYCLPGPKSAKRQYKVNGFKESPIKAKFIKDDGTVTTVVEYFAKEKRYTIKYPHFPCLWVGSTQRKQPMLVPPELCTVVKDQTIRRKLTEMQTRNMIRHAATSTEERRKNIEFSYEKANFNNIPSVKEFGFQVSGQFEKLEARVLDPPRLLYGEAKNIQPSKGVWRAGSFLSAATISKWGIICFDKYINASKLEDFENKVRSLFFFSSLECDFLIN